MFRSFNLLTARRALRKQTLVLSGDAPRKATDWCVEMAFWSHIFDAEGPCESAFSLWCRTKIISVAMVSVTRPVNAWVRPQTAVTNLRISKYEYCLVVMTAFITQ